MTKANTPHPKPTKNAKSAQAANKTKKTKAAKPTAASIAEERAIAQAQAKARRADNQAKLAVHFERAPWGMWIVWFSWLTTAAFVVPTVIATITNDTSTRHFAAYVSLALFALGMVIFPVALVIGAQRSRTDEMTMAGWWFLSGSAPKSVRVHLWGALALQSVVSIVCAALRFETSIAFGVLVPTLGLSLLGLWGGRYGYFEARKFGDEQS